MNRRSLLTLTAALAGAVGAKQVAAQVAAVPSADELKAIVQDDTAFARLLTEVWVLRDLLALQQGGDISTDTKEFQQLQDQLRKQRTGLIDILSREQVQVTLSDDVITSGERLTTTLDSFGIRSDSDLGKRLIAAYLQFNQALFVASLGSLCNIHPFRVFC